MLHVGEGIRRYYPSAADSAVKLESSCLMLLLKRTKGNDRRVRVLAGNLGSKPSAELHTKVNIDSQTRDNQWSIS